MTLETATAIDRFADVAAEYIRFVESEPGDGATEMRILARLLASLHLSALDLPEVFDDDAPDAPPIEPTLHVRRRFAALPLDTYWDVFDPLTAVPEAPIGNSLSDDLADIYGDLKRGAALFAAGKREAAAWEWRFHFHIHWGNHLVGAQRAIHLWLTTA